MSQYSAPHVLPLPEPISWWPLAIGWQLLLLLLLAGGVFRLCQQLWLLWQERHRRQALRELAEIEGALLAGERPDLALVNLRALLRGWHQRLSSDDAVLYSDQWLDRLFESNGTEKFRLTGSEQQLLQEGFCWPPQRLLSCSDAQWRQLCGWARAWIGSHDVV